MRKSRILKCNETEIRATEYGGIVIWLEFEAIRRFTYDDSTNTLPLRSGYFDRTLESEIEVAISVDFGPEKCRPERRLPSLPCEL